MFAAFFGGEAADVLLAGAFGHEVVAFDAGLATLSVSPTVSTVLVSPATELDLRSLTPFKGWSRVLSSFCALAQPTAPGLL